MPDLSPTLRRCEFLAFPNSASMHLPVECVFNPRANPLSHGARENLKFTERAKTLSHG